MPRPRKRSPFTPISRRPGAPSPADQVAEKILGLMEEGALIPGQRLDHRWLAEHFEATPREVAQGQRQLPAWARRPPHPDHPVRLRHRLRGGGDGYYG